MFVAALIYISSASPASAAYDVYTCATGPYALASYNPYGAFYATFPAQTGGLVDPHLFCLGAYAESAQEACDKVLSQINNTPTLVTWYGTTYTYTKVETATTIVNWGSCYTHPADPRFEPLHISVLQLRESIKYTITLSGGSSVEPWNRNTDKKHLTSNLAFKAIVKDQAGNPKANISVTINTDVTANSGGHLHNDNRPKGKLLATAAGASVSTLSGAASINGQTDSNGVFFFNFGAEETSGEHKLTATCDQCKTPAIATVDALIPGLMQLDADPLGYTLRGEQPEHPDSHYFSEQATVKIINLAFAFKKNFNELLKINDSSLKKGGVFDLADNWTYDPRGHKAHRVGIVVDINNFRVNRNPDFEKFVKERFGIVAIWEGPTPTYPSILPHYHLWLLGVDH